MLTKRSFYIEFGTWISFIIKGIDYSIIFHIQSAKESCTIRIRLQKFNAHKKHWHVWKETKTNSISIYKVIFYPSCRYIDHYIPKLCLSFQTRLVGFNHPIINMRVRFQVTSHRTVQTYL